MRYTPLRERARGRWRGILSALGVDPRYLTGKHGSCPFCGGKDRWRFTDYNNDGVWICNQCGIGSGTDLVMRFLELPFREAARRIEAVIGAEPPPQRDQRDEKRIRASLNAMLSEARPVRRGDPTDCWLRYRGLDLNLYPQTLRTTERLRYYEGVKVSRWPAMLGLVSAPDGSLASIHRTYLTKQGFKAPVPQPRKLYSSVPTGSAVRLSPPRPTLGVAEGVETALSAARLFGIPTWSALCAHGIETFEPPPGITSLIIFGDNDTNGTGQTAAHALAARLADRIRVEVRLPGRAGSDWNDVLIAQRGTA
jgi:putative DNA primase/helicase